MMTWKHFELGNVNNHSSYAISKPDIISESKSSNLKIYFPIHSRVQCALMHTCIHVHTRIHNLEVIGSRSYNRNIYQEGSWK